MSDFALTLLLGWFRATAAMIVSLVFLITI